MSELRDRLLEARVASAEAERDANLEVARKTRIEADLLERRLVDEQASADDARTFYFHGQVNAITSSNCMETLGHWSRKDPGCSITVVFNSPGGGVFEGLALYDFIQDLKARGHKITTKSVGMAASMGGILLQAGNERVMGPNAYMLVHEVSAGSMGKVSEMEDTLEFMKQLQEKCVRILAKRSKLNETQIRRRWKKKDWWFDATEALDLGFIDRIEE